MEEELQKAVTNGDKLIESQNRNEILIEKSHDIIYELDSNGIFVFVSSAWERLLGHKKDQVIGHSFKEFMHSDDILKCQKFLETILDESESQNGVEYRVSDINGCWRWHHTKGSRMVDFSGTSVTFIGVARDINEQKQVQISFENYLNTFNHDVRSAVSSVIGFSDLLLEDDGFSLKETKDFLTSINRGGKQIAKLLDSYYMIAKIEQGKEDLVKKLNLVIDLKNQVTESFDLIKKGKCKLKILLKNPEVDFSDSAILRREVFIDETIFSFAVCNLLKNAIEASPSKESEIVINLYEDNGMLCIAFSNDGEIPEKIRKKLFEKGNTSKERGSGLGLFSAKRTFLIHGGDLLYQPIPGGTRFIAKIPF
jgi:PAS domain S-box-containing protein